MSRYIQIEFQDISSIQSEMLIAVFSNMDFEGFEESPNNLKAYIHADRYNEVAVKEIAGEQKLTFTKLFIQETNWNTVWESNFQPVIVDDFVAIRADFHEPIKNVQHEIIITPKMSFGTGHHATTYLMIQQMREIDFIGKTVFDFGTGTGVLAILAEKLGAAKVAAVDNDDWSIANAEENFRRNNSIKVSLQKADTVSSDTKFDIILANINKNVLIDNLQSLAGQLSVEGLVLLSGLLISDETDMLAVAGRFSLILRDKSVKDNWISLKFTH